MGYSDISRRGKMTHRQAAKAHEQPTREVVRFKVGVVYKSEGVRFVCVDRYTDDKGSHVGMVALSEIREEKKDEFGDLDYQGAREGGFACHDEYYVRMCKGVEYAIDESDLSSLDGEREAIGGRYDVDCDGCLEEVPDVALFRADKTYGVESLEMPEPKVREKKKSQKSKKGNPIIGLFLIVVIIGLIRACST